MEEYLMVETLLKGQSRKLKITKKILLSTCLDKLWPIELDNTCMLTLFMDLIDHLDPLLFRPLMMKMVIIFT